MSAAVRGSPSENVTPDRMSKVQVSPSSEVFQAVASPGSGEMSFML